VKERLVGEMRWLLVRLRWAREHWQERAALAIAWRLPRWLVYWCAIRVGAKATTGQYGTTEAPKLLFMDALKRWEQG
jgi:hypothetical protein